MIFVVVLRDLYIQDTRKDICEILDYNIPDTCKDKKLAFAAYFRLASLYFFVENVEHFLLVLVENCLVEASVNNLQAVSYLPSLFDNYLEVSFAFTLEVFAFVLLLFVLASEVFGL
jgi:hypothetical protein